MIQIDMPMPENCVECRFNVSEFGYCNAAPKNFCGIVNDLEEDGKPEWCPLKAQEPIEARLHLCESCKKQYPDCEATKEGIVFGNGIGNDNIIGCTAYDNRWMSQNEPRVLALDEIHSSMTVWLEDVDKADVILAITESKFYALHGLVRCFITSDNRRIAPLKREYGIRWRAWTSEPTDEQRKAVKWE
jgi:hypothetical protein